MKHNLAVVENEFVQPFETRKWLDKPVPPHPVWWFYRYLTKSLHLTHVQWEGWPSGSGYARSIGAQWEIQGRKGLWYPIKEPPKPSDFIKEKSNV